MKERQPLRVPSGSFGLRGRIEDFRTAERELGKHIPMRGRPLWVGDEIVRIYRLPEPGDNSWPTTGEFRKLNIQVLPSGSVIAIDDEPNQG